MEGRGPHCEATSFQDLQQDPEHPRESQVQISEGEMCRGWPEACPKQTNRSPSRTIRCTSNYLHNHRKQEKSLRNRLAAYQGRGR